MRATSRQMSPTPLARALDTGAAPRPTALDALEAARRTFLRGERVEMQALADELGISRVTLHRWVGNRDLLLGEVIWSLAEPALREARAATRATGAAAIAEVAGGPPRAGHQAPRARPFPPPGRRDAPRGAPTPPPAPPPQTG